MRCWRRFEVLGQSGRRYRGLSSVRVTHVTEQLAQGRVVEVGQIFHVIVVNAIGAHFGTPSAESRRTSAAAPRRWSALTAS